MQGLIFFLSKLYFKMEFVKFLPNSIFTTPVKFLKYNFYVYWIYEKPFLPD